MSLPDHTDEIRPWWLVIPAAGSGRRLGSVVPKQFLPLGEQTVLAMTLSRFVRLPGLQGVVLAVSAEGVPQADQLGAAAWAGLTDAQQFEKIPLYWVAGGAERVDSVCAALDFLRGALGIDDAAWVLVHDAARPCVRSADVLALLQALPNAPAGALLAVPVRDTLKRAQASSSETPGATLAVAETVSRTDLYHALTPQAFPLARLRQVLGQAVAAGVSVTDESSAIEWSGYCPRLVLGHADNLKITQPEDLPLARWILQAQSASSLPSASTSNMVAGNETG